MTKRIYTELEKQEGYIQDELLRKEVHRLLLLCPDAFFEKPASSTGKYHPNFAKGEKGLLYHTIVAVEFAKQIIETDNYPMFDINADSVYAALLLHDVFKYGKKGTDEHTCFEHPLYAADFVRHKMKHDLKWRIANDIASHMGKWNTSSRRKEVLPVPHTMEERLVHLCDFLASRSFINIDFNILNNID